VKRLQWRLQACSRLCGKASSPPPLLLLLLLLLLLVQAAWLRGRARCGTGRHSGTAHNVCLCRCPCRRRRRHRRCGTSDRS
jgi:hypothetical protein